MDCKKQKMAIGVFDSGYGGLTILDKIRQNMPEYDYIYYGDNARAPYGSRSFEVVYQFTLQAVKRLFDMGCPLVILACNTASAKALRSIQQKDLPHIDPTKRVLGIIRPTVEVIDTITKNNHVGIFGTPGTVASGSYPLEIAKISPDIQVSSEACPMWVPIVENNEANGEGADYFIKKNIDSLLEKDPLIDTVILGCTHYPLLYNKIRNYLPDNVNIISQGDIVAKSLKDYLSRHPEIDSRLSKNGKCFFYSTESKDKFKEVASVFLNDEIDAHQLSVE